MKPSNDQFSSAVLAAWLLLANFLLQYLFGVLLYDLRHITGLSDAQNQPLVMVLAYGVVLVSVMHYRHINYRDLIHSTKSSLSATVVFLVLPALLLVPLGVILGDVGTTVVQRLLPLSRWEEQAFSNMLADSLPAVIATCVLAPVFEEMLFRGVLLRVLLTQSPRWAAISYSALLFGAAHLNVYQFLLAFWLGLLLGWLYERSRSLLPSIALHAAYNTAVMVLALSADSQRDSLLGEVSVSTWLAALAAAGVGTLILRRVLTASSRRATDVSGG